MAKKKKKAEGKKTKVKSEKQKKSKKDKEATLKDLLEAGCHFGHKRSKVHPNAKKNIYAIKDGIAVFDLAKTKEKLDEAKKFVSDLTEKGKKIVFVGTKRQASEIIREEAKRVGVPFITNRWLGGTITNWDQIKENSIDKLNELRKEWKEGKYEDRPKKEQAVVRREITRLDRLVGGIADLEELFGALFIVDIEEESTAVQEARQMNMPVVAIVDSNSNPDLVDYPIPANDDATRSIQLLVREIADSVISNK
jgi:small subunit ribosomal protein S2